MHSVCRKSCARYSMYTKRGPLQWISQENVERGRKFQKIQVLKSCECSCFLAIFIFLIFLNSSSFMVKIRFFGELQLFLLSYINTTCHSLIFHLFVTTGGDESFGSLMLDFTSSSLSRSQHIIFKCYAYEKL